MRLCIFVAAFLLSADPVSGFLVPTRTQPYRSLVFCRRRETTSESRTKLLALPLNIDSLAITVAQETSANLLQTYENSLRQHPITTKAITSAFLAFVGDAIAQFRSCGEDDEAYEYDKTRGAAYFAFGALYTGVFQHFWFQFLSSHISQWGEVIKVWGPARASVPLDEVYSSNDWWLYFDVVSQSENPPSDAALAFGKLIVNQFLMVPGFYMPLFFALTGTLAKLDLNQSISRAQAMYIPLLKRNYSFWLPVQFIQFLLIPTDFQIPFLSLASLAWTVILSSIAASSQPSSPSAIVAYETLSDNEIQIVEVSTNNVVDDVSLEDVEKALVPQSARDALSDPIVGATTAGGALGLLAAAADGAQLGGLVGGVLGAEVGAGVAVVTAVGGGVGLLVASKDEKEEEDDEGEDNLDNVAIEKPEDSVMKINVRTKLDGQNVPRDLMGKRRSTSMSELQKTG